MVKKTLLILIFIVSFSCNDKRKNGLDPKDANNLKEYLNIKSSYLHEINGFYIASSSEKPTEEHGVNTTADVIFEKSIRLFSSFLDQDNNGKLDDNYQQLSEGLAKYMTFILGHRNFVDEVSQVVQEKYDIYGMGFFSDSWPHELTYDGTGFSVNKLNSSMWRPEKFDAVWEETFHTLTEVYSRIDDDFKFTEGAKLRQYMEDDIVAGTYDISEQNTLENGNYDKVTAVNEYIHQIWVINFSGKSNILNEHQTKALNHMKERGVPMKVNPKYSMILGTKIK